MAIFYQPNIRQGEHFLDSEESRHCARVLRKRPGDTIQIVDGLGTLFTAVIRDANPKKCTFDITDEHPQPRLDYSIHLLIAPTKNSDRMEWMVEKLTEIGIDAIQFVQCTHSERTVLKLERLQRKAISAMKQSERAFLPKLLPMVPLTSWKPMTTDNAQKYIAHLGEEPPADLFTASQAQGEYYVLVGPEGDFSQQEIDWAMDQGFQPVRLGHFRLRTETAGLSACHTLHLVNV
ncbi:MAG: 16S rRNA (uracil(1498)-N(3))-methyltransferase [Cyclobacteriaceae bacterium]